MSRTPKPKRPPTSPSRGLTAHDYEILAEFRHLLARFLAFSERAAHEAGLAPRQHQALLAIKGFPGNAQPTVGDLAERLGVRHHSAVGLVDRLVSNGYLVRLVDATDRRRAVLSLTVRSEEILGALSAVHREELRRIAPLLKPLLSQFELPDQHA